MMAFSCCFDEQILYKYVYGNSVFHQIQIRHVTGKMFFIHFGRKGFETATRKHCNNKHLWSCTYYSSQSNLMLVWNQASDFLQVKILTNYSSWIFYIQLYNRLLQMPMFIWDTAAHYSKYSRIIKKIEIIIVLFPKYQI